MAHFTCVLLYVLPLLMMGTHFLSFAQQLPPTKVGIYDFGVDESTPVMYNGRLLMMESIVRSSPQWAGYWLPSFANCSCYLRVRDQLTGGVVVNLTSSCNFAFGAAMTVPISPLSSSSSLRSGSTGTSFSSDTFHIFATPWIRINAGEVGWTGPCKIGQCTVSSFTSSSPTLEDASWSFSPGVILPPSVSVYNNDVVRIVSPSEATSSLLPPSTQYVMVIVLTNRSTNFLTCNSSDPTDSSCWTYLDPSLYFVPPFHGLPPVGSCPSLRYDAQGSMFYMIGGGSSVWVSRSPSLLAKDWELATVNNAVLFQPSVNDTFLASTSPLGSWYKPSVNASAIIQQYASSPNGFGDDSDVDLCEIPTSLLLSSPSSSSSFTDKEEETRKTWDDNDAIVTLLQYGSGNQKTFGFSNLALYNGTMIDMFQAYFAPQRSAPTVPVHDTELIINLDEEEADAGSHHHHHQQQQQQQPQFWTRNLFSNITYPNARCLDGSPGGYYFKQGDEPKKWILGFQGGGWCGNISACLARSVTALGSSKFWPPTSNTSIDFNGVYAVNASQNENFYNWTSSMTWYCDGTSFSGYLTDPFPVPVVDKHQNKTIPLYFRGAAILEAYIDDLLLQGLGQATEILVNGGSAGGLSTMLHVDYIASRLKATNPTVRVSALADCGFFIDATDVMGNSFAASLYQWVSEFSNATYYDGGSGSGVSRLNDACIVATPPENRWQCFMAQFVYPHIKTPLFLIQSSEDAWQLLNLLVPDQEVAVNRTSYIECFANPSVNCNTTQFAQFMGYHTQFYSAFNMSLASSPVAYQQNGAAITSCEKHGQAGAGIWDVEMIRNTTLQMAFVQWYEANGQGEPGEFFYFDGPWGTNPTCTGPMPPPTKVRKL